MNSFLYVGIFLFGLTIGSFMNVIIWRLPRGKSVVLPPSHCPSCNETLKWWQLIPVISFLLQKGKCSTCTSKISWRYPLIELLFAINYLIMFIFYGLGTTFISASLLTTLLITASIIDLEHMIIPNKLNFVGAVAGLSISFFTPIGFKNSILGLLTGALCLLLVAMISGGMGGGDIKFLAALGTFLGWQGVLLTIFLASILGSIIGIGYCLITRRPIRKMKIPYGPFLSMGAITVYIYGNNIINWYLNTFLT